jgi:hypothetical protein
MRLIINYRSGKREEYSRVRLATTWIDSSIKAEQEIVFHYELDVPLPAQVNIPLRNIANYYFMAN